MSRLLAVAKRHPRLAGAAASVVLIGVFDVTVRLTTEPEEQQAAVSSTSTRPRTTARVAATTTTASTAPAPAPTAPVATPPPEEPAPPPPAPLPSSWPSASTTGAGSAEGFATWGGSCTLSTPNQVVENTIFNCSVAIRAPGVTIRRSVVRSSGELGIDVDIESGPATIEDVTIEPASGCNATGAALGYGNYHATRVKVVNFSTAFLFLDNDTIVRDSYAKLCDQVGDDWSSSGLEGEGSPDATADLPYIFDHNTIDQRCGNWAPYVGGAAHPGSGNPADQACDALGAVVWYEAGSGLQVTDNLLRGGDYTIEIRSGSGHTVAGNVVERASYARGPVLYCTGVANWSNNLEADVTDAGVASGESAFNCGG